MTNSSRVTHRRSLVDIFLVVHLPAWQMERMGLRSPTVNQSCESRVDKRRRLTLELQHETQQTGSLEERRVALVVVHMPMNPVTPHAQWLERLSKSERQKVRKSFSSIREL